MLEYTVWIRCKLICNILYRKKGDILESEVKIDEDNISGLKWLVGHQWGHTGRTWWQYKRLALRMWQRRQQAALLILGHLSRFPWMEHLTCARWTSQCTKATKSYLMPWPKCSAPSPWVSYHKKPSYVSYSPLFKLLVYHNYVTERITTHTHKKINTNLNI